MVAQISSCDTILASMEEMLGKFQGDLGNISTEIRALQEQSQSMSVKLKNRRAAEGRLGSFIEALALPPALVEGIMQSEVNETFQVGDLLPCLTTHLLACTNGRFCGGCHAKLSQ